MKSALGIKGWLVTIATVIMFIGGAELYIRLWERETKEDVFNLARLKHEESIGAVFVGSSLSYCALPFDDELTSAFSNTKLAPAVRISLLGLRNDDLLEIVYEQILAARPKYLFLEAEIYIRLFFGEPFAYFPPPTTLTEYPFPGRLHWLFNAIKQAGFSRPRVVRGRRINEHNDTRHSCAPNDRDRHKTNKEEILSILQSSSVYEHLFEPGQYLSEHQSFFRRAAEVGISVYFLEVGRALTTRDYIEDTLGIRVRDELNATVSLYGVPLISRQGKFNDQDFFDHVHMNFDGRAAFMDQLVEQVKKLE